MMKQFRQFWYEQTKPVVIVTLRVRPGSSWPPAVGVGRTTWNAPWRFSECPLKWYHYISGWWWLEHDWIIFPYIGNVIIPIDELIFFRGVAQPQNRYSCTGRFHPNDTSDMICYRKVPTPSNPQIPPLSLYVYAPSTRRSYSEKISKQQTMITGWWFGSCFIFPSECHHPSWRAHIFQRGSYNQKLFLLELDMKGRKTEVGKFKDTVK